MKSIISSLSLFWVVALLVTAQTANATTMRAYSKEELVLNADVVVIGRAVKIESHRNKRGTTVRRVTFRVEEYVVGKGTPQITIQLFGGTLNGIVSKVSGEANLSLNTPTLLFLGASQTNEKIYRIVGMAQGHFRIIEDTKSQSRFFTRSLGKDLHLVDEVKNDNMGLGQNRTSTFIPYNQFISEIKRLAVTHR